MSARFHVGDRLIYADHNELRFGRVIDREGSQYRYVFPEDGDRDTAYWADDDDSMAFVHVDDSAIARALIAAEARAQRVEALAAERDVLYPKKFKPTPSENYVLGWRDLQRAVRAALGATPVGGTE